MKRYLCYYTARQTTGFTAKLEIEMSAGSGADARTLSVGALSLLVPDTSGWEWSHGHAVDSPHAAPMGSLEVAGG